jgi:hypothetical protein
LVAIALPLRLAALIFPDTPVIILVRQDLTHKNLAAVIVHGCDQAVFVPADVKDDTTAEHIGVGEHRSQFVERRPVGVFSQPGPRAKWRFSIGMALLHEAR